VENSSELSEQKHSRSELSPEGFHAELEVFSGPLDLLLHLIKRNEVDILEVPIAPITEQYLQVLRAMQFFDVNLAGEFLVMAATLMDIKSRSLLPETHLEDEGEPDPRDDLVRQLLEYKRFRDVSQRLAEMARDRARMFGRDLPEDTSPSAPVSIEELLQDVSIWDLLSAYGEVVRQIELKQPVQILYDELPVKAYMEQVLNTLREAGGQSGFLSFMDLDQSRNRMIGILLAILELVRLHQIKVEQTENDRSQFVVMLCADKPDEAEPGQVQASGRADEI
jgi:segregation and condensation protein A